MGTLLPGHMLRAARLVSALATPIARVAGRAAPSAAHALTRNDDEQKDVLPARTLAKRGYAAPVRSLPPSGPSFDKYRKTASHDSSRAFAYMMVGATGVVGATMAKTLVVDFVKTMAASADVLALASVEVDLSNVAVGSSMTVKWRGKPVFVRRRTDEEIAREAAVDVATLRDKQTDAQRHAPGKPEWLLVLGVCTHLGCVPMAGQGDYNGYFCPCHGSHYDGSGRIRAGPAPLNLEVVPYEFLSDNVVKIG
eukprot:c41262_g1_i1.p2 GENE.c41262_g1_i1~~c41262_g1_i1.p2  ORF type:complete len:252 (-),score=39.23 c41262_g1_i1:46-801(-)